MKEKQLEINSYYQGLIQNLYAGREGCFIAFMQFFYQRNQSQAFKPELLSCFESLCESELENCKILSELLLNMGADNKYCSSSRKFLSAHQVDYIKNWSEVLSSNIEFLEINCLEIKNLIEKIENKQIKNQLKIVLQNKKNSLKNLRENFFKNNLI